MLILKKVFYLNYLKGIRLAKVGELSEAITMFDRALDINPKDY